MTHIRSPGFQITRLKTLRKFISACSSKGLVDEWQTGGISEFCVRWTERAGSYRIDGMIVTVAKKESLHAGRIFASVVCEKDSRLELAVLLRRVHPSKKIDLNRQQILVEAKPTFVFGDLEGRLRRVASLMSTVTTQAEVAAGIQRLQSGMGSRFSKLSGAVLEEEYSRIERLMEEPRMQSVLEHLQFDPRCLQLMRLIADHY